MFGDRIVDQALDVGIVSGVGGNDTGRCGNVGADDRRPFAAEQLGRGEANARSGPGDDCDLAAETPFTHCAFPYSIAR